jgi:competence protein ComEC
MRFNYQHSLVWIRQAITAQGGRLLLWVPVVLGLGSASYLYMGFEPHLGLVAAMILLLGFGLTLAYRIRLPDYLINILILCLVFSLGFCLCKLRSEAVKAPVISTSGTYFIKAIIIDIDSKTLEATRLLVAPLTIEGLKAKATPMRLRLALRPEKLGDIAPGDAITALAIINPAGGPSRPGGYDYARQAWFEGLGGVGFIPGRLRKLDKPELGWRLEGITRLNYLRWQLTKSIVKKMAPHFNEGLALGGFAAAMVTGHQAFVPEKLLNSMRDSGLAHMISISGLHMALVGGFAFYFSRAVMALIPSMTLRLPIKKIAAGLSMVAVLVYLALSGMPAPAQRAAVVAIMAFMAIIFDRQALSLRNLAIAGIIVIALTPEAVIEAGFQMSFTATAALLALAETYRPKISEINVPWWVQGLQSTIKGMRLALSAGLVASLATAPLSMAYFNRLSLYGLIANLFEAPITGLVVMPALALGTLLSSTPLAEGFLYIAGGGLWMIREISDYVAGLPGAVQTVGGPYGFTVLIALMGVFYICLIKGAARWLGLIFALSLVFVPKPPVPDVWIDEQAANAGIRLGDQAIALRPKVKPYGFEQWTRFYDLKTPKQMRTKIEANTYICKSYLCSASQNAPYRLGFYFGKKTLKPEILAQLCRDHELVVVRPVVLDWPQACKSKQRIDGAFMQKYGALELKHQNGQWLIKATEPKRGLRFWVHNRGFESD